MPTCRTPQPGQIGGWGMHLVNKLASAWGAQQIAGNGKCVWFELEMSADRVGRQPDPVSE